MNSVPVPVYVGIALDYNERGHLRFGIYVYDAQWSHDYYENDISPLTNISTSYVEHLDEEEIINDEIIIFLKGYQHKKNCKILIAGLINSELMNLYKLGRKLWFGLDILPFLLNARGISLNEKACSAARKINQWASLSNIPGACKVNVIKQHEVEVDAGGRIAYCNLEDYKKFFQQDVWEEIIRTSKIIKDSSKTIIFFNSTPQGGGVAILRHSMIRFCRLLGINAHWFVMKPNLDVYEITKKKFHNVLQGIAKTDVHLTATDKHIYSKWCEENVKNYWSEREGPIYKADMIVFDDPQVAGIIPHIKKINTKAIFVYRSHIEIRSDLTAKHGSTQHAVWSYLWNFISQCDIFVSHPLESFLPKEVKESSMKIKFMPATTDPCDGLNKKLDLYSFKYYQLLFNRIAVDQIRKKVNFKRRPYFVQISRFDPSKGISDLIDAYMLFRKKISNQSALDDKIIININKIPQLVITGHGSVDDPEGDIIYKQTLEKLNEIQSVSNEKSQWVDDVIVVRLGPSDQMLNAILAGSTLAFQLSIREGFEVKVSEASIKGIPVVAYRSGGIVLQIEDGKNGYLIEKGDISAVCDAMYKLTTNRDLLESFKKTSANQRREWILSPYNVLQWNKILLDIP